MDLKENCFEIANNYKTGKRSLESYRFTKAARNSVETIVSKWKLEAVGPSTKTWDFKSDEHLYEIESTWSRADLVRYPRESRLRLERGSEERPLDCRCSLKSDGFKVLKVLRHSASETVVWVWENHDAGSLNLVLEAFSLKTGFKKAGANSTAQVDFRLAPPNQVLTFEQLEAGYELAITIRNPLKTNARVPSGDEIFYEIKTPTQTQYWPGGYAEGDSISETPFEKLAPDLRTLEDLKPKEVLPSIMGLRLGRVLARTSKDKKGIVAKSGDLIAVTAIMSRRGLLIRSNTIQLRYTTVGLEPLDLSKAKVNVIDRGSR